MSEEAAATTEATTATQESTATTDTATAPVSTAGDPWYTGLSDDLRGYVETKGWQDQAAVVESYRNAEKLLGLPADRVVKLPKHDAPAEEWMDAVWSKLGRPEQPDGYGFQAPEGGDTSFADWAGKTFHELGVPREMGAKIAEKYEEFIQSMDSQYKEQFETQIGQEQETLKKDWGAAYEQNKNIAAQAAQKLGVDAEALDALESQIGFAKVMEMFHSIGTKMGEADFVGGDAPAGFGIMSPQQAQSRIQALRSDSDFIKRYTSGDLAARDEMERLHKWAYPEG